ncbi:MAG: hypothetical protein IE928_03530 [Gammaproteobacteria bacterium]|nr:hypothetical protein [Gammaproteobacteria bacterium]
MFENDIFDTWLDNKSREIILKIDKEKLTSEEMMILMLKAQTNHFVHLDVDLRNEMAELNKELRQEMSELNKELRQEMSELNKELRQEMSELNKELRQEMIELRKDMDKRFEALTTRIDRFMVWSFSTSLAIGGAVVAAIRYLPAVQP